MNRRSLAMWVAAIVMCAAVPGTAAADGWSCGSKDMYGYVTCTLKSGGTQTDLTEIGRAHV